MTTYTVYPRFYVEHIIRCVQNMLALLRPDVDLDITYCEESETSVQLFSDFQRKYHGILPGEDYIYIRDNRTGDLLYAINVTGNSYLTTASELMKLIARKF